jgi:hypothetical protein
VSHCDRWHPLCVPGCKTSQQASCHSPSPLACFGVHVGCMASAPCVHTCCLLLLGLFVQTAYWSCVYRQYTAGTFKQPHHDRGFSYCIQHPPGTQSQPPWCFKQQVVTYVHCTHGNLEPGDSCAGVHCALQCALHRLHSCRLAGKATLRVVSASDICLRLRGEYGPGTISVGVLEACFVLWVDKGNELPTLPGQTNCTAQGAAQRQTSRHKLRSADPLQVSGTWYDSINQVLARCWHAQTRHRRL